ncbi:unnamed protein product [Rotaria sordida]|uniref:NHL repeat protein n=1 Tax=Rotaria sordida TaxID=392033 RepID=A0A814NVB7_9BILA|nr:unnamed protein product [Rotaria sordida]
MFYFFSWLLILIGTVQSCCITKLSVPNSICANATWVQHGVTIAGGYGTGNNLNQFGASGIYGVRVDECASVYITDDFNHRIIKWDMGSTAGIIVAGGNADINNHRIVRWAVGDTSGNIVAGGNGQGSNPNQLSYPFHLTFDPWGNLLVSDRNNNRVQKFVIDSCSCH